MGSRSRSLALRGHGAVGSAAEEMVDSVVTKRTGRTSRAQSSTTKTRADGSWTAPTRNRRGAPISLPWKPEYSLSLESYLQVKGWWKPGIARPSVYAGLLLALDASNRLQRIPEPQLASAKWQ
ncbi:predicted protein [Histoplasma capsulatum H143]|uniref:Uncharacterized protein n=1 Tax=Ajellomyces capsulatus (strain H143) TaxID=544712 RepID=C6HHL5_AJECH|nr:predicted protein [Histoplasma capsulatum H143]